jgi:hypothetical protein
MTLGIAALGIISLPIASVEAIAPSEPSTPPTPTEKVGSRLEQARSRERDINDKLGNFFNNIDERIAMGQEIINKAKANGKDTTDLQQALEAFSNAVKQARRIHQGLNETISSHTEFNANGNVAYRIEAFSTVSDLLEKLFVIHQLLPGPGQGLRDEIKTIRSENAPAAAPAPTHGVG